jgi:3-carboxy-cis,cis-muconate cycloisomerase
VSESLLVVTTDSALLGPTFGTAAATAATDDRALLTALCETEAALARACARTGLLERPVAALITAVCDEAADGDPTELGEQAVAGGNPVIPLVADLRVRVTARAGADAAAAVHYGATSQDILDTALMLVAHRTVEHAEWPALIALLRTTTGAATRLRVSLTGLVVDSEAMRRNLSQLSDVLDVGELGHAPDLVDRYLARRSA